MLKKTEAIGDVKDIVHDSALPNQRVLCITAAISEIKTLDELLGCKVTHTPLMLNASCAVIMHGVGRPARKAMAASTALDLPLLYTEFGPIQTFDHKESHALSMTVDHLGPPSSSDRETYLEGLIKDDLTDEQIRRTEQVINQWKRAEVSRFNHSLGPQLPDGRFVVVLAEPTPLGGDRKASREVTDRQIAVAKSRFPAHTIVVVDVKEHAVEALKRAEAVFTHSSPIGFEALLWGKPLYVQGMPFYAGWGLTEDSLPAPARRQPLPHGLAQLTYAYLIKYSRYVNPFDNQRLEIEQAIEFAQKTRPDSVKEADRRETMRGKLRSWLGWMRR